MEPQPTRRLLSDQEPPEAVRDNIIELGKRRKRFRDRTGATPEPVAPLDKRTFRSGAVLGYFYEDIPIQVIYGSSTNLWLRAALDQHGRGEPVTWDEFDGIDRYGHYQGFAVIDWRNGITTFTYNGPDIEPKWMPLYSPAQAVIQYKATALYWHCTKGHALTRSHRIMVNPNPVYIDPTDPDKRT